jgi:hypothetical protein
MRQSSEKSKNTLINEFEIYKGEGEMERKISIKKEDFKKIVVENQEAIRNEVAKLSSGLTKDSRKASFPFSHREHPILTNQINNNSSNQYFQHDKNFQIAKQGSNSKNDNFFSNKMNRNNVILNTNITSTHTNNNPIKPGQKKSDEKVILSPTNLQLNTNGSIVNNVHNNNYITNNFITNTLPSENGDSNPNSKPKKLKKGQKVEKQGTNINSINKVLVTQSENSIENDDYLTGDKRSISNKTNSKAVLENKKGKKEIINRSSSNNKFSHVKMDEKKKLIKKTSAAKVKKNKQVTNQ